MKEITCAQIAAAVERLCVKAAVWLPADMAMQIECACDCEVSPEGAAAVSYTHLDVYKRQVIIASPLVRFLRCK